MGRYCSSANETLLRAPGLLSGIQKKGYRNHPLSASCKAYNKDIGRYRYKIARVLGSIARCFGVLRTRYGGLLKMSYFALVVLYPAASILFVERDSLRSPLKIVLP